VELLLETSGRQKSGAKPTLKRVAVVKNESSGEQVISRSMKISDESALEEDTVLLGVKSASWSIGFAEVRGPVFGLYRHQAHGLQSKKITGSNVGVRMS
jgi:hypothetical protein